MSEFHNAFYRMCSIHEIEHPKWRKCPKCEEKIIYSEKEVEKIILYLGESNPATIKWILNWSKESKNK